MELLDVGDVRVIPISDGVGRVTPGQLFGGAPSPAFRGAEPGDWAEHAELLDAQGRLEMPVGSLLVLAADRRLLLDLGFGHEFPATVEDGASLLRSLRAAGFEPSDITDVVLTHLHTDHIGWASLDGSATFPNATYRCDERDWAYFVDDTAPSDPAADRYRAVAREKLVPIASRFEMWSSDGVVCAGVDHLHAPGHTPGNTIITVSDGTERAVFLGDVVHCPVQLLDDDWARIADVDPVLARRTQVRVAQELEGSGALAVGAHFPGLRFGRVLPGAGRRQWAFAVSGS